MSEQEVVLTRDDWKRVQRQLQSLGFYFGVVDGKRGPLTDSAIVAFKKSVGMAARPFFGPLTYGALMAPATKSQTPWMDEARAMRQAHERRDTQRLKSWFHKSVAWIDPREISWCGAFVATCILKWRPESVVPQNVLGARQWGNFGEKCEPQVGAVLTFWRISRSSWQGHVGFMAGQDRDTYHVLGGNQSDAVTITKLAKNRLLESRWPTDHPQTRIAGYGTLSGTISTNEA